MTVCTGKFKHGKVNKIFWNIWTSYAVYYFGRVNLSIVVPALLVTYKDLNLYSVGLVSSGFFFAYAIGQFLHGQISQKYNPFVYISFGLIASGFMNFALGFCGGFFSVLFLGEVLDGLFQSMGWSSCVRANAITQDRCRLEKSSVILGTSYQIGNSVAWLVSSFAVGQWGWQAGFWIASVFLITRGILLFFTRPKIEIAIPLKLTKQIRNTLSVPILLSGLSLCVLNMVRYGVIIWIPLYLFKRQNLTVDQMGIVGLKIFLIPIAGVLGTLTYNRLKIKKDILTVIYLLLLSFSFMVFPFQKGLMQVLVLLIGSFFLYGPHVFLVTTFPSRFIDRKVVAASAGFIDGMGYLGTVLIGLIVPFLLQQSHGDWFKVFALWSILSIFVAIIVSIVYSYGLRNRQISLSEIKIINN